MFEVTIDGKQEKADVTFYTAWLYEAEFGKDLISDFYGVADSSPVLSMDDDVVKVDFTKVGWLAATRVLWAAVKTAKGSTPGYESWMKQTRGVDAWEVRQQLDEAISDCFFRAEAAGEDPQG